MGDTDWEEIREQQEAQKQAKIARFYDFVMPQVEKYVAKFQDVLILEKKSNNHYQVKNLNTGDLLNIWHTRAMQRKNGQVMGLGYREENLWKELENIIHERK